jgi:sulfate transport system ATP-binding protein
MNHGRIEQVGSPAEVFDHPASDFVIRFLGQVNVLDGRLFGGLPSSPRVYVRPHELDVHRQPGAGRIPAKVLRATPLGAVVKVELAVEPAEAPLRADLDRRTAEELALGPGDAVWLSLHRTRVFEEREAA